jgi:hypothetical protein
MEITKNKNPPMRNQFLIFIFLLFCNYLLGQKKNTQIELNPYLHWDKYPTFSSPFNSVIKADVTSKNSSWGLQAAIKKLIKKDYFAKLGLGYYKYSFSDVKTKTSLFGIGNGRVIDYRDATLLLYSTSKYWYNTLCATIAVERMFAIKKNRSIFVGADIANYYTFFAAILYCGA